MIRNRRAALEWWRELQPLDGRPGDRAARARLRRCATVAEAMQEPATIGLFRRLGADHPADLPAVALAAAVLAHVREDRPEAPVARQAGPASPDQPETAALKPLRFRRLMEAVEPDDRLMVFRRLAALLGGTLNVADLADALLAWTEDRRRRWTYEYWGAGQPAAPATNKPAHVTSGDHAA